MNPLKGILLARSKFNRLRFRSRNLRFCNPKKFAQIFLYTPPPPRADLDVQTLKTPFESHPEWRRIGLRCSAATQNIELSGDDHAPVTRGRMRAQYALPHGPPGLHPEKKCHGGTWHFFLGAP